MSDKISKENEVNEKFSDNNTTRETRTKAGMVSSSPSLSFSNFFKPKSATKIPKAPSRIVTEPPVKNPTQTIKTLQQTNVTKRKILVFVLLAFFVIVAVLIIAVLLKNRPEKVVGKRGELTWWGQREEFLVQPLIDKFEQQNPGVTINYQKQKPIDYRIRLQNLIEKGEAPDIFSIHNTWVPVFVGNLDTLPSEVIDKTQYINIFYPAIVGSLTTTKGIVGIPIGYDALVLFINQDIFSTAFASPPETWDDFRQLSKFLTDRSGSRIIQSGSAMGLTENVNHWQEVVALLMVQNGVNLNNPTGDRANEIFDYYSSFAGGDGGVWDDTLPESVVAFANGKLAMLFAPTYRANEITRINPGLKFITVPVPQVYQEEPAAPDITYATFWSEGVWTRSVNRDIAWDFLKFMIDRDNQIEFSLNYQIKGLTPEVFPRKDMRVLIKDDSILGPVVNLADYSVSWYLAGGTMDGEGSINYDLSEAFKIGVKSGGSKKALADMTGQVQIILSKYGLTTQRPPVK